MSFINNFIQDFIEKMHNLTLIIRSATRARNITVNTLREFDEPNTEVTNWGNATGTGRHTSQIGLDEADDNYTSHMALALNIVWILCFLASAYFFAKLVRRLIKERQKKAEMVSNDLGNVNVGWGVANM